MKEKRCKKCDSPEPPVVRKYIPMFHGTFCTVGVCPIGEHLHLTCSCGYQGVAPVVGGQLGEPHTPATARSSPFDWLKKVVGR